MHKIEHLLQTLAPKGVEFKKIGEICLIKRGRVIAKKSYKKMENILFIHHKP